MKKIITVIAGLLCLACTSCTKEISESQPVNETWMGEFTTTEITCATNKEVEVTGVILMEFENDGNTGIITLSVKSVKDQIRSSRYTFEARWTSSNSFDLYPTTGEQIVKAFSGTIVRKKMTLYKYVGGAVETTFNLTATSSLETARDSLL
ncbi:MAG: hypothetical protein IKN88_06345 [Bacteroidales bacterium]|nr:hypothetical protein [Bacteroidales bacterium]